MDALLLVGVVSMEKYLHERYWAVMRLLYSCLAFSFIISHNLANHKLRAENNISPAKPQVFYPVLDYALPKSLPKRRLIAEWNGSAGLFIDCVICITSPLFYFPKTSLLVCLYHPSR